MNIGGKLVQARENMKLSVYELSKLTGVTQVHIHQIEKGITRNPGVVTLKRIAKILNITLDYLLAEETEKEAS